MFGMLDRFTVHHSDDLAHAQAFLQEKHVTLRALRSGDDSGFRSRINAIYGKASYVGYIAYGGKVVVETPAERPDFSISFLLRGQMASRVGDDMVASNAQRTVISSPGDPSVQVLEQSRRLTLSLSERLLADKLELLSGEPIRNALRLEPILDLKSPVGAALLAHAHILVDAAEIAGQRGVDGRHMDHFEDVVSSLLLLHHPHSHSSVLDRPAPGPASADVKRVIDFIAAHHDQPLTLADLVEIAGVPGRSLNAHFRRFTGHSPVSYLRHVRLQWARDQLEGGAPVSISDIALDCGYSNFGRFAHHYRRAFGELPSQTRARAQQILRPVR
ncbi:helix-turn-helix domain-containing protein [Roseobacter sinensis]|uniref:AraC family transcriptional regulator n=1 Tax=Roseobacter sinensis TaxID=2931391 RepID=A0ABT3BID6_9RHOB|nr:AraC family transcriptional regulator [Roseobacter sp. WL0113]MCV3273328.1 AraC family transcriptional regulator [Roseobacter sp. WL0113]